MKKMKAQSSPVDLRRLRRLFGRCLPLEHMPTLEGQIGPGRWRKIYGCAVPEQWVYRATNHTLKGQPLPFEQIAKNVDNRSLIGLLEEGDDIMKQICARAASGDEQALSLMVSTARGVIVA